ncbi:TetR/AcrR family transcriptional regulator [Deinococcus roseus]|uniref:TetR family transcriptional regulator n=1 Tax=Deinococcus roseus TaxID=392414 RepID=A0ABQ2CV83_9DEIO|nr:TetR/AcrR family transcriptional regulator [Deinococcus roseus]GGJ24114.1 TetR family transcriptional regulator [Deinococcus roseus]
MKKGEQTRQHIVERAAPIFNTRGFSGTSIQDVLRETGLEKGGLYNHFKSKDELALEAFDHAIQLLRTAHKEAQQGRKGVLDRLQGIFEVTLRSALGEVMPGGCPVLNVSVEADDTHPQLKEQAQKAALSLQNFIAQVLAVGIKQGELKPELDPEATSRVLFALFEGGILLTKLHDNPEYLWDARNHMMALLSLYRREA